MNPKSVFPYAKRHQSMTLARRWVSALALFLLLLSSLSPARPASAEGTKELVANDPGTAYRAVTEWRTGTLAGLYRRTFLRVYARAGENILMGSSGISIENANIVLYRESQIPHSQVDHSYLDPTNANYITPAFSCNAYRATNPGAGELRTRAQELAGPLPNAGGYNPCVYTAPASETYWVAMYGPDGPNGNDDGSGGTVNAPDVSAAQDSGVTMWDITVRDSGGATQLSRVFVDYLAQITGNTLMSTVYAVTEDGFIYQVDFNELDPYGFIFYGNRVGFLDPDGVTPLHHDLVANNAELTDIQGGVLLAPATAKMFFSDPRLADDLPPSVLPTPTPPDITNISFSGSAGGLDGYFGIGGEFTYTGNIGGISEIIIQGPTSTDFAPDNPRNRVLRSQSVVGTNVITWDGLDNEGIPFPVRTDYPFQVIFHAGEYHFPLLDVENSPSGGPIFTLLNPLGGICPLSTCRQAFYDDRGYVVSNGTTVGTPGVVLPGGLNPPTTPSSDMIAGFDTATNQRAWGDNPTNYQNGFGNIKGLDLWTYYPVYPVEGTLNVVPQVAQDVNIVKKHTGLFSIGNNGDAFQITARNVGYSTINGAISVNDALPPGLTPISASGSGWSCSISGQDVYCTHPNAAGLPSMVSLPPITVVVYVNPYAAPSASNTAYVLNDNDSNLNNNSYTDTVTIDSVDIAVQKSADNLAPEVGDTVTFTISASNSGPSTADSIVLSDALPAGLTYVSHATSQGDYSTSTDEWSVGALPAGYTATLTLTASVDAETYGQSLTNTAAVASTIPYDYNSANNSASVTLEVVQTTLQGIITDSATGLPIAGATVTVIDSTSTTYTVVTGADGSYRVEGLADGAAAVTAAAEGYQPSGSIPVTLTYGVVNTQDIALDPAADLQLTKTDARSAVLPDTDITYTITVTNHGAAAAQGVQVTDPLGPSLGVHDPNLTIVSLTSGGLPVSYSTDGSGNTLWSAPDLDPGESAAYLLTVHLSASATGSVTNYAEASTTTTELDTADNAQSDTDAIQSIADLSITLDDGVTTVQAGESLTYTLTYANLGTATASAPVVTVQVPAGLTSITPNNGGTYNAGTGVITWNLSDLPAGGSGSLSFTAAVVTSAAPGAVITPSAAINSASPDLDSANNSASDSDTVARPVLTLAKSASGTVQVGVPLTYTIDYTNTSTVAAQNVVITDALPTGMDYFAGCYPPGCAVVGSTLTWTVGTVAPGASGSVSFQVVPTIAAGSGTITNTANAAYRGSVAGINYTATASADVTLALQLADLRIEKTSTTATPTPGGTVVYRLTVTNDGPTTLTSVDVFDVFPEQITPVTYTPSSGAYNPATGAWTGISLATGGSVTLDISCALDDFATGTLTNSAYVSSSEAEDPDLSDNADSYDTVLNLTADVAVTVVATPDPYISGTTETFTITVTNNGPSNLNGIQLTPSASAQLNGVTYSYVASVGTYDPFSGLWSVLSFEPGDTLTLTVTATIPPTASGAIIYSATVAPVGATDSNSANNTASDTVNQNTTNYSIGNRVWVDNDGDGVLDTGEANLANARVELFRSDGVSMGTRTTSGFGLYSFTGIPAGVYYLVFAPPTSTAYVLSQQDRGGNDTTDSDPNPATGRTANFTLTANTTAWDAGMFLRATLGDRVWYDTDADGIQDGGETGGPTGLQVQLFSCGADGACGNADDSLSATTTTGANGAYSFSANPGTYYVHVDAPSGYTFGPNTTGTAATGSDVNPLTGNTPAITVTSNQTNNDIDVSLAPGATLGDRLWIDSDADGIQDATETAGYGGVTVRLYNSGGTAIRTAITASDGRYTFAGVAPGTYSLGFPAIGGYTYSAQDQGSDDSLDSDANTTTGRTANFTVSAGEVRTNLDAGVYTSGSVTTFVWSDNDRDGVQDGGEGGINGVSVLLRSCGSDGVCGNGDDSTAQTASTAGGNATFNNVTPGLYYLRYTAPPNYTFTYQDSGANDAVDSDPDPISGDTAGFLVTSGSAIINMDAGLLNGRSVVGDFVWFDADRDGIQDAGEPGIPNVTVTLRRFDTHASAGTDTTDASGRYIIPNIENYTYYLEFTVPSGYTVSPSIQGGNDLLDSDVYYDSANARWRTRQFTTNISTFSNYDMGMYTSSTVTGRAWTDADANGVRQTGEPALGGITVGLYNAAGTLVATTTTAADGTYSFTYVLPGTYSVRFTAPDASYSFTTPLYGGDSTRDSNAVAVTPTTNPPTGQTAAFTLSPDQTLANIDAGLYQRVTIGDYVWNDTDGDGVQDAGEPGISGRTVELRRSGTNALVASATTNASGQYSFNVAPGSYYVRFSLLSGYVYSPRGVGADATNSDADTTTGQTTPFTMTSGQSNLNLDAGMLNNVASIGDFTWRDTNGNGIQDAGETGLVGVSVALYTSAGTLVSTTTSSSTGTYFFSNVAPGDYYLIFTAPGGFSFGPDGRGSDPTRDSNADPLTGQTGTFTVTAGLTQSAVDAALVPNRAVIGDRVWDDVDGDGIQDAGEAGISGVTVRLYRELVSGSSPLDGMLLAGTLIANTTTDSAGEYVFTNLTPGTYTVGFVRPSGYVYSMPDQGSDASIDSNADPFTGESAPVSVVGGETNRTLDAALIYGRATVGSRVWNDVDIDGIQDAGEQGLRGITVRLYNDSGVLVATTTTGLTGQYAFTNLAPGSYRVQFVNSSGLLIGPLNQGGDGTTDSDADPNNSGYTSVFTIAGGDINGTLDASMYADPTGVDVGNLEAFVGRNRVTLTWQSTSETEIEGYRVYRAEVGSSDETLLTAQMIDALYSGDSLGMIYNWVDYSPLPFKQYVYTVEVIHLDGSTTRLSVIVETLPYMIYLPMLGR